MMTQLPCIWAITTEARCDGCNYWIMGSPFFCRFCIWFVLLVTYIFVSHSFEYVINVMFKDLNR